MKNLIITLLFISSFVIAETSDHKKLMSELVKHYNSGDYQQIFVLYSETMKAALPLSKSNGFFSELKKQQGEIKSTEFTESIGKATSIYKTTFSSSKLSIKLSSDKNKNISGLYVTPLIKRNNLSKAKSKIIVSETSLNEKQLKKVIKHSQLFPNNTQISIALIKAGRVDYFGIHRIDDTLIQLDNHAKAFEIGSISKVFTSTILANLVQHGKIDLDDTIDKYLDITIKDQAQISFKDLASHHSGLPRMPSNFTASVTDNNNPFKDYGTAQLLKYLDNDLSLNKKTYAYSNLGAGLLAYTLSVITNKSYQQLLDELIFNPYKMKVSTTNKNTIESSLINGLDPQGKVTSNWDLNALSGSGAILSTVEDLAKFALAQFDQSNKALALTRQKTNKASKGMDIGLGWHIIKQSKDNYNYWHNGGTGGYSSSMIINPQSKNGIIILSNVSAFNNNMSHIDGLTFDLMKTL